MDRAPGLSVRLKLTLSYAGFLMLAGAVLLAAGYFSLSRGVHPGVIFLVQSHAALLRYFAPIAAIVMAFLLVFGLLGGWLLAGRMLAPLTRITDATRTAATGKTPSTNTCCVISRTVSRYILSRTNWGRPVLAYPRTANISTTSLMRPS